MIIGFVIVSAVAAIFLGIGISCRKSHEAVGFFTFMKPPMIEDVERYNHAVSILWFVAAGVVEIIIGLPFILLQQNSPLWIPVISAVMILVIVMIIVYLRIEAKYKK